MHNIPIITNNNIGLDTIKLIICGTLKKEAQKQGIISLHQSSNTKENSKIVYVETETEPEQKYFLNLRHKENRKFQVNFHNATGKNIYSNCTIQCSVPKINNKPFELGGEQENKFAYEYLLDEASKFWNFKEADVKNSRLDVTRNLELDFPMEAYKPLLGSVPKTRDLGFQNTFYQINKSYSHCIYDKIDEIKSHKIEVPEHWNNKNIARNEIRLLTGSKLKQLSNTLNMNLLEPKIYLQQDNLVKLQNYFLKQNEKLFKYTLESIDYNKLSHSNQLLNGKKQGLSLSIILQHLGLHFLTLDEAVKLFYAGDKNSRQYEYEFKQKFMKHYSKIEAEVLTFRDYKSLLDEIRTKTLMKVA